MTAAPVNSAAPAGTSESAVSSSGTPPTWAITSLEDLGRAVAALEADFVGAGGAVRPLVEVDEEVRVDLHPAFGEQFTRSSQERSPG